ncbi:HD domain-containing protein [Streptomyces sp. NPDC004542]|uniref:HD domain-containing protein n=1 Tax=Streptomyces sp. NPDC004542 TaxID=3154281 RepID=UPI0033B1DA5E
MAALGLGEGDDSVNAALRQVGEIIGGHRGRFHELTGLHPANLDLLGGPARARQRAAHIGAVFEALGRPAPPERLEASAAFLETGVVSLADWLVSQETYLRERQWACGVSLAAYFRRSCVDARTSGCSPLDAAHAAAAAAGLSAVGQAGRGHRHRPTFAGPLRARTRRARSARTVNTPHRSGRRAAEPIAVRHAKWSARHGPTSRHYVK